ncbi:MAG: ribosome biogenesis GTPase YlqF [Bacilli bacterium]|nr:ribosome biogenesis GTPase YlqF [Bacilli bacterium]
MPSQIHWFPGHMNKALHEVEERVKLVDVVIELLDARAPFSSINEQLEKLIANKKKLIVLSKPDLADPNQTDKWKQYFIDKGNLTLVLNLTNPSANKEINAAINKLGQEKWAKQKAKGMKPQPIRTMILGIPNVGKSSLINRIAKRSAAGVQNKPGYTRGEQWIKVNNDYLLLDTPGILPMNYDNQKKAANLALLGAIREDILPKNDLVDILLKFLKDKYPHALKGRFDIEEIGEAKEVLEKISSKRGLLTNNGAVDYVKSENLLLKEFKDGLLGRMTLEWL